MNPLYGSRDVIMYLRTALDYYESAQAGKVPGEQTLEQELEKEAMDALARFQVMIDDMARIRRIWLANGMNELLASGQPVGEKLTRERLIELQKVFEGMDLWLKTPLSIWPASLEDGTPEVDLPPIVIVSRRGNPPTNWGMIPPGPQTPAEPEPPI